MKDRPVKYCRIAGKRQEIGRQTHRRFARETQKSSGRKTG